MGDGANRKWDPAARHSKANKEARLMGKKACFILDSSNWGRGRISGWGCMPVQGSTPSRIHTTSGQELL